ncbi:hypothetical protein PR048_007269 [Dryococelus australis]|uniref:Uncharacterized protein n=1 Tax=Dryococelus australis TaxID=614101 RepID=A0ABQ9ID48_9NEOP|nr:hypothetical protein PR048_007269 [Dryococelus australis]
MTQGRRKQKMPESSGTINTCENPWATPPGIELGSACWEASSLTITPPLPRQRFLAPGSRGGPGAELCKPGECAIGHAPSGAAHMRALRNWQLDDELCKEGYLCASKCMCVCMCVCALQISLQHCQGHVLTRRLPYRDLLLIQSSCIAVWCSDLLVSIDSRLRRSRSFACVGIVQEDSAGLPFPQPFHPGADPYSPRFTLVDECWTTESGSLAACTGTLPNSPSTCTSVGESETSILQIGRRKSGVVVRHDLVVEELLIIRLQKHRLQLLQSPFTWQILKAVEHLLIFPPLSLRSAGAIRAKLVHHCLYATDLHKLAVLSSVNEEILATLNIEFLRITEG